MSGYVELLYLSEETMEEISKKTGRSMEELRSMLANARGLNQIQTFTIWSYDKKVGEE